MRDKRKKYFFIRYLPVYGCVSTGLIYLGIGVIALLSFFKVREGGADEGSMLAVLNDFTAGKILIWVILTGTVSYVCWRIYETVTDPYGYGRSGRGLATRTGIALSTVADIFIAGSAIRVLLGISNVQENGQPLEERKMVGMLLDEPSGMWLVTGIGAAYLITAVVQLIYGVTGGYRERIDIGHFSTGIKNTVHFLAWAGYFARSIILGIIGFFFVKAGVLQNPEHVVNTDKAFDFIGDDVGHVFFILVALGTICYGLFMGAQAAAYDTDKD